MRTIFTTLSGHVFEVVPNPFGISCVNCCFRDEPWCPETDDGDLLCDDFGKPVLFESLGHVKSLGHEK